MKKLVLAAIALALAPAFSASAQQGFHAGLTTGYYRTIILDNGLFDSPTYDHQNGWGAAPIGLALGYNWESGNGIQVEVIKASINQEMDIRHIPTAGGEYAVVGTKEINLDYIQVPVLFKLQAGENKTRFSFVFGPQISILTEGTDTEIFTDGVSKVGGTATIRYEGNTSVPGVVLNREYIIGSTEETALYNFNKTALGGVLGFGLDYYATESLYISANVRLGYNFTEIREEEGGTKFADTPGNTLGTYSQNNNLYQRELRTAGYGGLQLGLHYIFGQ